MANRPGGSGSLEELDDDALVTLAPDRLDVFNVLARRYEGRVRTICRGIVGMDDADDMVQETFIKAWKGLGTYRQRNEFAAWLSTIARNTCRDYLRKRKRRPSISLDALTEEHGDQFAPVSGERSPDDHVLNLELKDEVTAALNSLSEEQRRAVVYHYFDGLKYPEIAKEMRTSIGTVKSRLSRARASLRDDPAILEYLQRRRAEE